MIFGVSRNPTKLTVGMTGVLDGRAATVVGWAVLQSAERYRWHEYYVQLGGGGLIILVFERGVWKRFDDVTAHGGFDAREAASYRCDSSVVFDSRAFRVAYVSTSRVLFAEGQAIEGVRVGSEARYFNAQREEGDLLVVSWTGDEIEFYAGKKLSNQVVPRAFQLPGPSLLSKIGVSVREGMDPDSRNAAVIFVGLLLLIGFVIWAGRRREPTVNPPPIVPESVRQLVDHAQGVLGATSYTVLKHSIEEIDEVGFRFRRYEYELIDDRGNRALLVQSLNGGAQEWHLFRSLALPATLTPNVMGNIRGGNRVRLGTDDAIVRTLFLDRTPSGAGADPTNRSVGTVHYGFVARAADEWVLARWSESAVELDTGRAVPEAEVLSAFGATVAE